MARTNRPRPAAWVALMVLFSAFCFPLQPFDPAAGKASAGGPPPPANAPPPRPCPACAEPGAQVIYAPTIALPEAAGSELVLNSRSPNVMDVTPTLYTEEGTPVVGEVVRLQPSEIRFVKPESLIPAEQRGRHKWGGITLSYTGGTREVWAQLALRGVGGARSVDVLFSVLKEVGSDVQEGLWWMPDKGRAVIALGNSSDSAARATLLYGDGASQEVELAPYSTAYVRRQAAKGGGYAESVRITTAGPAGSVRPAGFVTSAEKGFASSIRFYDPQAAAQQNLFATSLHLKDAEPRMLLRNVSDYDVTAVPRFFPGSGGEGGPVELPAVALKPRETVRVDLSPLAAAAAARPDLGVVSVRVENTGPAGSLIGALYSTDSKAGTLYDVPLRDSGPMRNLTGAYPWRLDDDYSTEVSITNIGDVPARFAVNIFYEGGKYVLNPRELAAGETARFDLRRIRDEQVPDRTGAVIPRSVSSGQFNWSVHGLGEGQKLIGRGEVVSRSRKVSISYSCPTCCPNSFYDGFFNPNVISVGVNQFVAVIPQERYRDCYLRILGPYDAWPSWSLSDSSVAQVSQSQYGLAQVSGLAVGSTTVWGTFMGPTYTDGGQGYCYRYTGYSNPSGPIQVNPTVSVGSVSFTSPSPPVIRGGETATLTVILSGSPQLTQPVAVAVSASIVEASGPVSVTISPASQDATVGANQTVPVTFSFKAADTQPSGSQTLKARVVVTPPTGVTVVDSPKTSSNTLTVQVL